MPMQYLVIYLAIGLIIRLVGPIARDLNKKKQYFGIRRFMQGGEKRKLSQIVFAEIMVSTLFIIFWPLLVILFIPHHLSKLKKDKKIGEEYSKRRKYLFDGGDDGQGTITCCDCLYEEYIVVYIHDANFIGSNGFQCQSCGKFHTIRKPDSSEKYYCECGGVLSKENIVFCPICKSENTKYEAELIT